MDTTESILLIAAAVGLGYWFAKKQQAQAAKVETTDPLAWLGGWSTN